MTSMKFCERKKIKVFVISKLFEADNRILSLIVII